MKNIIFILLIFAFVKVQADSPARPTPRITASSVGNTYFSMIPERYHYEDTDRIQDSPAFGRAYKLDEFGETIELWEVTGWYAFEVYVSNNGRYLVRIGNWAQGREPSEKDLAVSFYDNGKELKKYSTKDLVKNPKKVQTSTSHYVWRENSYEYPKLDWQDQFHLKTIDGYLYTFNIKNGQIVETVRP